MITLTNHRADITYPLLQMPNVSRMMMMIIIIIVRMLGLQIMRGERASIEQLAVD